MTEENKKKDENNTCPKYTDVKKYYKQYIGLIWVITIGLILTISIMKLICKKSGSESDMIDYNTYADEFSGGGIGILISIGNFILNNLWWMILILIATSITLYILFYKAPKIKNVAYIIHFFSIFSLFFPFSRIYMKRFKESITFMYLIPPLGWFVDTIQLFIGTLEPDDGFYNN